MKFPKRLPWLGFLAPIWIAPVTAAAQPAPICTDRPAKANAVCTVPSGALQAETNAVGWSLTKLGGTRTEVRTVGSTFVKVGLSDRSDIELGFSPYVQTVSTSGGQRDRVSGFSDLVVRYKQRLTRDGAKVQVGVIPFVKLPTAKSGIGNGKVEGGLAVPISFSLGAASMTLGPELDLLANVDGHGRHVAVVNLINVAGLVTDSLTIGIELWSNVNFASAGTVRQASLDGAMAYVVSRNLQLDAGANLGITQQTPDIEVYAGASVRF